MREGRQGDRAAGHAFAHRGRGGGPRADAIEGRRNRSTGNGRGMTGRTARYAVARAALGGAFARERGRLALAALAIALGVALGFAVDLVNRTAVAEFASGMATLSGNADLEVRGPRAGFDESVYPMVAGMRDVAVASPIVELQVRVAGFDEPLTLFGIDAFQAARVTPALVGVAKDTIDLLDPHALFMSAAALERYGAHVGGTLTLSMGADDSALRVAGFTGGDGHGRYATMDIGAVQDGFARAGTLTRIDLRLVPGADPAIATREIGARLPAGVIVAAPTVAIDAASRASRAYRVNMAVLALV